MCFPTAIGHEFKILSMKTGIVSRSNYLIFVLVLFLHVSSLGQGPGGVSTGLRLWLRADAGVTSSAGAVSAWADQSGIGNTVTQSATSQRPAYYTTGGNLINFNPTLS